MVSISDYVKSAQNDGKCNTNFLKAGMKLTDTYKTQSLFLQFKSADVDEDGIISEKEFELYEKKDKLKKDYFQEFYKAHRFSRKQAIPLILTSIFTAGAVAANIMSANAITPLSKLCLKSSSSIFLTLIIGSIAYLMFNILKSGDELDKKRSILNEQCKKLDEEYMNNV